MYKVKFYSRGTIYGTWLVGLERKADTQTYWLNISMSFKDNELKADWNQYVFKLNSEKDLHKKKVQEDLEEFNLAASEAVCFLEQQGELTQSLGLWECLISEENW